MFEELFLTDEEEKMYQLKKLEKRFILLEEDMLFELDKNRIEALDKFNVANKSFFYYKHHLSNSSSAKAESFNKGYEVNQKWFTQIPSGLLIT